MSLLLLRIPNDDDLFNIDVSRHAVFFQVKDVAFDLGRFTGDRNPHTANLDLFAKAVFKKIPHSNYSSVNWVSTWLRFYLIVLPMRNLMAPRGLGQDAAGAGFPYVAKTFDTVDVHFRRVDAARVLFRRSGLPATCL